MPEVSHGNQSWRCRRSITPQLAACLCPITCKECETLIPCCLANNGPDSGEENDLSKISLYCTHKGINHLKLKNLSHISCGHSRCDLLRSRWQAFVKCDNEQSFVLE